MKFSLQNTLLVILATTVFFAVTKSTLPSIPRYRYDKKVGSYVLKKGLFKYVKEGGSTTRIDNHGFQVFSSNRAPVSVTLFGDSYVEAFQVNDTVKMTGQLFRLLEKHSTGIVAVAEAGRSLVDHISLLLLVESLYPATAAHIILIADIEDIYPEDANPRTRAEARFFKTPSFHFEKHTWTPGQLAIRETLGRYDLRCAWRFLQRTAKAAGSLRFSFGTHTLAQEHPPEKFEIYTKPPVPAAWSFLLDTLRASTTKPLAVVYLPRIPHLDKNHVQLIDPAEETMSKFGALCRARNIRFYSLKNTLMQTYRRTRRIPFGFNNGLPGRGHLNAAGHTAVAQFLYDSVLTADPALIP